MTAAYAPPINELILQDFQNSSDTDNKYHIVQKEYEHREVLIHFRASSKILLLNLVKSPLGYWTASSETFAIYGDGNTFEEAIFDYIDILQEYYNDLKNEKDILGPFLKNEFLKLDGYFQ